MPAIDGTVLSAIGVGFVLGLKHALDADHLAAVGAMMGEGRRSVLGSSRVGVLWGLGHAASLIAVSAAVIGLGVTIPAGWTRGMEIAAGATLVVLGGRLLWLRSRGAVLHAHPHEHGPRRHVHPHVHLPGVEPHRSHHALAPAARRLAESAVPARRPILVGAMHGLAGSGALMVIVLATIGPAWARAAYVALFAGGSIAGMGLMSLFVGLPFALGGAAGGGAQRALRLAAGIASIGIGLLMVATAVTGAAGLA